MSKLNGYRASHRNKWLFVQSGILTIQELSLLEFYADIVDFDKTHQKFGLFEVNFEELRKVFNCKSQTTIRNWHNKLLITGFIKKTNKRNLYALVIPERYINPSVKWQGKADYYAKIEKDQPIEIILQNFGINLHPIGEKLQQIVEETEDLATKNTSIAISSSKDDYSLSIPTMKRVIIKQESRSEEEYRRIYREGNYQYLTPEDMKWVDENISEDQLLESNY